MKPLLITLLLAAAPAAPGEWSDEFDRVKLDPSGREGWQTATGDGAATMTLRRRAAGHASIEVDATADRRGIWWALIERQVPDGLDLTPLGQPGHEVTIEARVRVSHAPRRINLQVIAPQTTGPHAHLMEFDIPDTSGWHTVRMTTRGFRLATGDRLIAHLALMDWGLEKYRVDVDYLKMRIVEAAQAPPDTDNAVPYHPPVANPKSFTQEAVVAHDSMIDLENGGVNLNDWSTPALGVAGGRGTPLLLVDGTHLVILRWDLARFAGRKVAGPGLLELTTHTVQRKAGRLKDFGELRVVEILGGDPAWDQATVTADSLRRGQPLLSRVLNPQPIIDWPAAEGAGARTLLTISRPVLQRLIDGKTLGLAIKPLGALSAGFHALEGGAARAPRLRFSLAP